MSLLHRSCENCHEPIDQEKDTFIGTYKQDHNPNTPGIPAERVNVKTYRCPECGHSPIDDLQND